VQVHGGVVVEPQRSGHRVERLLGGMLVAPSLQPHVVVGRDAGEHRKLLAAQARHPAAAAELGNADFLWAHLLAPSPQELTDTVLGFHPADGYSGPPFAKVALSLI
jgi:hypothetical protein